MLKATVREAFGKGAARKLRSAGLVPAAIYPLDPGQPSISIALPSKELEALVQDPLFLRNLLTLDISGNLPEGISLPNKPQFLPEDIDFHPVTEKVHHINLKLVLKEKVVVRVPIKIIGSHSSPGLRKGGKLNIPFYYVKLSCEPGSIPKFIPIDISKSGIGRTFFSSTIKLPSGCSIVKNSLVYSIIGRGRKDTGTGETEEVAATAT